MNGILRKAAERLRAAGIESARADARILFEHAQKPSLSPSGGEGRGEGDAGTQKSEVRSQNGMLKQSSSDFSVLFSGCRAPPHPNPLPQRGRGDCVFEQLIQRRLRHEPVAYITGHKEFWSLDLNVGPGVLIPRPETEILIEHAIRELPDREGVCRLLDLGTGSGCLLIAFLSEYPNAAGAGLDASDEALGYARRNVVRHGLESRARLVNGGWNAITETFDLILVNPPYIPSTDIANLPLDVRDYEPSGALDGGPDGLAAYRAIAAVLKRNLKAGGVALLEIGAGQHQMVAGIMERHGFAVPRIEPDLAGIPRCVVLRNPIGDQ